MAANSLVLFFFVLGMAGILKVDSYYKVSNFHIRSFPDEYDNLGLKHLRERHDVPCNIPRLCDDRSDSKPDFGIRFNDYINSKNDIKSFYPHFRNSWSFKRPVSPEVKKNSLKNLSSKVKPESVEILHDYVDFDDTSKNAVGFTKHNTVERHSTEVPDLSTYIPRSSSFDRSANPIRTGSASLVDRRFASDLKVTDQRVSGISTESSENIIKTNGLFVSESLQTIDINTEKPESKSSSLGEKVKIELAENKNEFLTLNKSNKDETMTSFMGNIETKSVSEFFRDTFTESEGTDRIHKDNNEDSIDKTTFSEKFARTFHSRVPEIDGNNRFSTPKTSSSEELLTSSKKENLQTESKVLNNNYSAITRETKSLGDKSGGTESLNIKHSELITNDVDYEVSTAFKDPTLTVTDEDQPFEDTTGSSILIQSTSNENQSAVSQSIFFTTPESDISSKIKLSSLEEIHSTSTEHFETKSTTPQISTTMIKDDTELTSESSSSFKLKSTPCKTVEIRSTSETFIPSSEAISTQFTNTVIKDNVKESFSIEPSSKTHFPSQGMSQNHNIEIPSIHTARVVITSIFLVIALIAIVVLAVYMFRLKRREVQYDQLRLIP